MALNATVAKLAVTELARVRAMYAAHEEHAEECHRQGFRAHYCAHGVNMWTDYDAICGECEGGRQRFHYLEEAETALGYAKWRYSQMTERLELVTALGAAGGPVSAELAAWVTEPIAGA